MRFLALLGEHFQVVVFKREILTILEQFTAMASCRLVLAPLQDFIFHKVIPRICG